MPMQVTYRLLFRWQATDTLTGLDTTTLAGEDQTEQELQ